MGQLRVVNYYERNELLDSWYQQQSEEDQALIDRIGNRLEEKIKQMNKDQKRKVGIGAKSKVELVYALARFMNQKESEL